MSWSKGCPRILRKYSSKGIIFMRMKRTGILTGTVMLMASSVVMAGGCSILDKCDIENTSSKDMDRYTSFKFLGDPSDPEGNAYRPDGNKFTYTMYYVNDDGASFFVSGILYDTKDKDNVGIYYIEYLERDPDTGKDKMVEEFGERED